MIDHLISVHLHCASSSRWWLLLAYACMHRITTFSCSLSHSRSCYYVTGAIWLLLCNSSDCEHGFTHFLRFVTCWHYRSLRILTSSLELCMSEPKFFEVFYNFCPHHFGIHMSVSCHYFCLIDVYLGVKQLLQLHLRTLWAIFGLFYFFVLATQSRL